MKRHSIHSGSCSCTSCVYKSQSKRPSIQHLIQEGSRIDRLYFGKYLPLRERKLLEKLIRTRGVYDDVRNQLLSTSGSSDQTRSDHKMKRRDDDSTEKSSAVLKIVDLVDRGQIGSSNTSKLSSCCSCCSCSSLKKIKKHMEKHPRVHRHHVPYEEIAKYTAEAERKGRRRRKRLSTKISSKIRAVHFKVKSIRSEPCTCTLSLSSIAKRSSKAFIKKVRSKDKAAANVQAQKVVTIERKALKKKICNCSCKIAKLPMKSIKKIKNIRKSTTKSSGSEMGNQRNFRIKKDSLTLFREKLLKKRAIKDWECEPGTCIIDECIPEQCLVEIKARGVGEARRRKYHNRISGTRSERTRISMSTRPKKVKRTDSRVQASPKTSLGPVICECKPISKSASSMTSFSKSQASKPLLQIKSVTTEVKRPKSPKQKPQIILTDTESYKFHETERVQGSPKSNLGPVICECKPTTKSEYSMTTIAKTKGIQPASKTTMKRLKPKREQMMKETVVQEKAYKTDRHKAHEIELVQAPTKSKLGHVICECKPSKKSTASMTDISRLKTEILIKRPITPKQKPQVVVKEMVIHEKAYKTDRHKAHEIELVQAPTKSKLGHVICECKPSKKSTASMTDISRPKTEILIKRPITPKQKPQVVVKEMVIHEKAYKTDRHKAHEIELVQAPTKSKLGHVICECKPSKKSTASMTDISRPKTEILIKRPITPKQKPQVVVKEMVIHEKAYKTDRHKAHETELVQAPTKSKLGHVICECKPSEKTTSSMTDISGTKTEILIKKAITPKQKQQVVVKERVIHEKAYKTERHKGHEKEQVQGLAKSKLGHVICECKPSTKSTSSMTFAPKSKTEIKAKRSVLRKQEKAYKTSRHTPREHYEYYESDLKEDTKEPGKQAVKISSSFKFEIEFSKKRHPALTDKELFEHVRVKRTKRNNRMHGKKKEKIKYQHSKQQVSSTLSNADRRTTSSQESQISYLRDSSSQVSKYNREILPFPRECDPLMCIPYECDPETCAQITRSKSRGKSARSSTGRIRRKSAGSTTSSLRTSSKSRYNQSESMESFKSKSRQLSKEPLQEAGIRAEKSYPERQAVRIGSNFSFNIEFYKENPPRANTDKIQDLSYESQREIKPKVHHKKTKDRGHGPRNVNFRQISSQSRSSQSIKNVQVGHKLKRCFCTLKLLQKKKPKVKHAVSKKTMASLRTKDLGKRARMRQTQTKSSGIVYGVPLITSSPPALLPYECEPFFCTPGECNPYECAERIKVRNRSNAECNLYDCTEKMKGRNYKKPKSFSSNVTNTVSVPRSTEKMKGRNYKKLKSFSSNVTNTVSVPRKSTLTSTYQASSKSLSRKIQSSLHNHRKQKTNSSGTASEYSSDKTEKQAVRIGSSFSFSIEFSKEKINPQSGIETTTAFKPDKPIKKERKRIQQKGIKVHKPRVRDATSKTTKNVKAKQTYTPPFLQRCFCTLKLFNKNKKTAATITPLQNKNDFITNCMCVNKSITTNRADISYHHGQSKHLSYTCDPYECEKRRMKLRKKYSNTGDVTTRSTLSDTSRTITSSKTRNTRSYSRGSREYIKKRRNSNRGRKREINYTNVRPSPSNKQAVRVGSSFSFNVEFYKEKPSANDTREYVTRQPSRDKPIKRHDHRTVKAKQTGPPQIKPRAHHKAINAETKGRERGIYVGSAIKRCLCTLKFHKKGKNVRLQEKNNLTNPKTCDVCKSSKTSYPLPDPQICGCKSTKSSQKLPKPAQVCGCKITKSSYQSANHQPCDCKSTSTKRSKPTYELKNYECAPDFCVPGTCNPYECYEEIKRRDIKPKTCDCKRTKASHHLPDPQTCECKSSKTSSKLPNPQTCECKKSKTLYQPPSFRPCDCKSISPRKSKPTHDLKDYECAPDFCVPGLCNPYDCYEEIKRRNIKLQSKTKTTHQLPNPQTCECKKSKASYQSPNPQTCECKRSKTSSQLPNLKTCECKSTRTSFQSTSLRPCVCKSTSTKRSKPTYDLKDYECAPDFCVPGMCNPYECYKEIKRRDTKRIHDRCVCTERRKRKSIVSMTTEYSSKSKSTQSKTVKQIPKLVHKVKVVRKEQRPTSSFLPSRQAVRIGSNFSFNIEFFKDRSTPIFQDTTYKIRTPKYSTVSDTTTVKKRKHRGTKEKRAALQHRLSQASNIIRQEDKGSNVGFILKRCFCTLGLQKKNNVSKPKHKRESRGNPPVAARFLQVVRVDNNKNKTSNYENSNVTKSQEIDIIKDQEFIKSRNSVPYRTLFAEECLQLNLQEGNRPFDENLFRQHLPASSTTTRSKHLRSRIDFNIGILNNKRRATSSNFSEFDDYQFQNLLNNNIQKLSSFYQSFYALNLQVSNLKKLPANIHPLEANECEPGVCIPYECDPVECLKRINSRLKRSKSSGTAGPKTKSVVTSVTKPQIQSNNKIAEANLKKNKQRPSQNNYSSNGISPQRTGYYPSRQTVRVGSEFSFSMEFYKDTKPRIDENMDISEKSKHAKDVATRKLQSQLRNTDTLINVDSQNKTTGISPLLKRCFCTLTLKNMNADQSKIKQKTASKQATIAGNIKKSKTADKSKKMKSDKKNTKQEKDESTMVNKPYGNIIVNENRKIMTEKLEPYECEPYVCIPGECDPRECYKLIQQRLKKLREHGVSTDYPKYKSTSSLAKRSKNITTKTVQAKRKDITCSKKVRNVHKTQFQREPGILRPSEKQAVTFGSNFSFKMEFFKDNNHFPSSSFSPSSARSGAQSKASPLSYNKVKGAGDDRKKTRDNRQTGILQPKMQDTGTNIANMLNRCFCTLKLSKRGSKGVSKKINKKDPATVKSVCKCPTTNVKSILKPYECEPQTCVIDKCTPIECDKRIQKRRLRSKSTKVNRKRGAKSIKSAVMNKDTATKEKHISKSFECKPNVCIPEKCDPYDCIEKLRAQGIIIPDVSKRASNKYKHSCLSTQTVETKSKSINTDKESILKRCFCVLKLIKSKPASRNLRDMRCDVCEPKIKKQTDLNKLIKKCLCTLKLVKKGKELTTKKSTQRIVDVKNRDKLKNTKPKSTSKLDKKKVNKNAVKHEKEMETLMPYSKKKFNKLESKTKLVQKTTNTEELYPCVCPNKQCAQQQNMQVKEKKNAKASNKIKMSVIQNEDQLVICPVCKDPFNATLIKEAQNKKKNGKKSMYVNSPNEQFGNQLGLCPACNVLVSAKFNKKQNIKNTNKNTLHSCLCTNDQLNLCPVCKSPMGAQFNKKQDGKKSIHFSLGPNKQMDDQSDLCPACKALAMMKYNKKKGGINPKQLGDQSNLCPECKICANKRNNKKKGGKKTIPLCTCENEQLEQSDTCPVCKACAILKNNKYKYGKKSIPSRTCADQQVDQPELCLVCKARSSVKNNKKKVGKKSLPSCTCEFQQVRDPSDLCPVCKARSSIKNNKKKGRKKSLPSCTCELLPVRDQSDLCPVCKARSSVKNNKKKDGNKSVPSCTCESQQVGDKSDLCPVCKARSGVKNNKKKVGKESLPSCTCEFQQVRDRSDLCPVCKARSSVKNNKKKDGNKSVPSCTCESQQVRDRSDLCPVCKARSSVKNNKKKVGKKSLPSCTCESQQVRDQSDLCPVCKARASVKNCVNTDGKKSIPSCICANKQAGDDSDLCPVYKVQASVKKNKKKDGKKSKPLGDQSNLCPDCKSRARAKIGKTKDADMCLYLYPNEQLKTQSDQPIRKAPANVIKMKSEQQKTKKTDKNKSAYSCPCCNHQFTQDTDKIMNKKDLNTSKKKKKQVLQNDDQSDLCCHCKFENSILNLEKGKIKKQVDIQSREDINKKLELPNDGQLEVCSCCNATKCKRPPPSPSPTPRPSPFGNVINILKCKYSGFFIGRKQKEKVDIEIEKEPYFEMFVNKRTMNIMNKDEVLANLGSTGKESPVMKRAKEAKQLGKLAPPVMELLIDKDSATIVNSEEIINRMIPTEQRRNDTVQYGKSGGLEKCRAKCQSLKAAEIHKTPPVKYTKSERTGTRRPHGSNCRCCDCLKKRKRVIYSTLRVQKSGAGDGKAVGKEGQLVGKDGKPLLGKDGKPLLGKDGKPLLGKDGKPLLGKDGKPLLGKDGKPLLGKDGKPLLGKDGKPLLGKDGKPLLGKDGKPIGAVKPRKLKPCVCGSVTCKKNWDKLKKDAKSLKGIKIKPCVCGTDICKSESKKIPELLLKAAKKAQRDRDKQIKRIADEKKYQKERLLRKKLYAKQDAKLWRRRKKRDRKDMRLVKKYEDNTPDSLKAAESLVDIGKFGAKALCDLMRSACRIIQHPRDGVYIVKDAAKYPKRAAKDIEQSCQGMGFFATAARVKRRIFSMNIVKQAITKLESHPITNFIIHLADKDPKKRMKKFKHKRYREQMDFECSLFMASLRKRPCLRVYYMCPWFYPHCVSLLGMLKEFTDILLFIVAVGVWSPCIFCMELCRAMVCCCLCTG